MDCNVQFTQVVILACHVYSTDKYKWTGFPLLDCPDYVDCFAHTVVEPLQIRFVKTARLSHIAHTARGLTTVL